MKNKWETTIEILVEHKYKSNKKSFEFIIKKALKHLMDIENIKIKTKRITSLRGSTK